MTNPMGFESVGEETALAFADIDGDGDLDALIGQSEGNTFLFENVSLGCPRTPARGCVEFGKGSLFVLEAIPGREKLIAKLEKGPTLGQADFGSPLDVWGSFYDLCLYDDQGGLAGQLDLDRPGDLCGAAPCWKELGNNRLGTGYLYKDTAAAADGFVLAKLKAGGAGKSSVLLKAQNDVAHGELAMPGGIAPALSVTTSVDVQMRTSDSGCYSATLSDVSRQDNRLFKAK
jgi:hypothetical protein